ncbi:MAG: SDR family NAD(P)-dependent oxidoreductase [Rhodobacteraceae bacterium]|nr:SDR family NAD(P)-dependent oxidoreductase [Paracoccaceae bacterium]
MRHAADHTISRRAALSVTASAALVGPGVLAARAAEDEDAAQHVPGAPISNFGEHSTAEEVTDGLDLTGKRVLITGCNSGLGLESMRVLAMRGAHILGAGRTKDKADAAFKALRAAGLKGGSFTPLACELSDFGSVAACAEEVAAMGEPLDVLMCNASIMALQTLEQVNGIERHFVVNHLGHFVLINRLIETVKAAPQGRVVVLSSLGYKWAPEGGIEFDNLSGARGYDPNKMYGQSKMANHLTVVELAKRLRGTTTTANSVHPGVINTNLGRHFPWYVHVLAKLIGWTFMKSVEEGAATQTYVATAPALAETSGLYFADCNPVVPERPEMTDEALAAKLWDVSEELTKPYLASV